MTTAQLWKNAERVQKKYQILDTLGYGAHSVVFEGKDIETDQHYAMKVIDKASLPNEDLLRSEVSILTNLRHPNIVNLHESIETVDKMYLILDLAKGRDLHERISNTSNHSEKNAQQVMKAILSGIDYFHSQNIVHRDLKPENILFSDPSDNSRIMISDFGISKNLTGAGSTNTFCGTAYYMAPEIIQQNTYGIEVDMWSVGCIAYYLVCGHPPFFDQVPAIYDKILNLDYGYAPNVQISDEAKDFISHCLIEKSKRFTTKEALLHPWLTRELDFVTNLAAQFREGLEKMSSTQCIRIKKKKGKNPLLLIH